MPPVIAVLDTDYAFLTLMEDLLTDAGYQPFLLSKEESALDTLRCTLPALVIVDPWLNEEMSGWHIITQLWANRATTHIPVIIMSSGTPLSEEKMEVVRAMRFTVVYKPFDLDTTLSLIATALRRGSRQRCPQHPRAMRYHRLRPLAWLLLRDEQRSMAAAGEMMSPACRAERRLPQARYRQSQ